jgi:hypothetical protein
MWNNVEEFAKWYEDEGFPLRPPQLNSIFRTNNASALVLYREGQFQVELYIADNGGFTPEHSHPGVESIIMYLSGKGNTTINNNTVADPTVYFDKINPDGTSVLFKQKLRLNPLDSHGLITYDTGFAFLSIEHWPDGVAPSSVTTHWEGETTGSIHDETIRKTKQNK